MSDEKKKEGLTVYADTGSTSMNTLAAIAAADGKSESPRKFIPIRIAPTLEGQYGKAWLANFEEGRRRMNLSAEKDAGLSHWIIEAPWAHPVWAFYSLVLIHLRPIPGLGAPTIHLNGATHEMFLWACNPEKDLTEMAETGIPDRNWLTPINFAAQMIYKSDGEAMAKMKFTVDEILSGKLSPDTDFSKQWVDRFGNAMIKREYR